MIHYYYGNEDVPMERNTELMLQVADFIESHPEQHDQKNWFVDKKGGLVKYPTTTEIPEDRCGTTACVAGWAVVLSGIRCTYWWDGGRDVLGITQDEANFLFSCSLTTDQVLEALKLFAKGETLEYIQRRVWVDNG